jgi:ABC-type branched-subunit amino acid transport system substrate-binding protein
MNIGRYTVALLFLHALACSRKSDTGATVAAPSPSASAGPTYGVHADEVVLGEPAAFTGPSAALGIEMWRGATAAFSAANDQGGVNGRKIRLVVADDAYDAEKAAAAVVSLVGQDVFAIFGGVGTPTIVRALPVVRKLYAESGLFYFANFTGAQPQRTPPSFEAVFNVRASYYQETKAMVDVYVAMGKKKIGTFVQDDAYGTDGRAGVEKALAEHGLSLTVDTRYPRGQKFETSTVEQVGILRGAGVDAVVAIGSYQACGAFVRDAREGGWNVPIHDVSFVGADQLLKLLIAEEGRTQKKIVQNLINTQVVPYYADTTIPAVAAYRAAIDRYQPDVPPGVSDGTYHPSARYTFGSLEGYVSARAFLAVLERAGRDLTRNGFYAAAEHMGGFDLGVGAPAELSPTRHQVLEKVWFTVATPDGWRPTETPASMLK